MKNNILYVFYYIFLIYPNVFASNSCESSSNSCEECIADSSKCVWCALINFNGTRCRSEQENLIGWCVDNIINPISGKRFEEKNLNFSSNTGEVVQIKPQGIKTDLRPGHSFDFEFSIKPAKDYPVDLYFLVDASTTMKDVKQKIVDETESIYNAMKKLTKNVYLGTGSFIDKNIFPFTRVLNSTLTYSFRNRLKLTDKIEDFQRTVSETKFGFNHDDQEGTLDALAQVITCTNEIGWRNESTKIILILTDGPYHCAGDGKYAGIYRPYDGNCYTEDGVYKNEQIMDYPSPNIIEKLAADREIIIIFYVKEDQENVYDQLSRKITGSIVTLFESDMSRFSMNTTLKKQYEKIRQQIKLKVNMDPTLRQHFKISFSPNCYHGSPPPCHVRSGAEKKFKAEITLLQNVSPNNVSIDILAEGIQEKLNLNINIIKQCNCSVAADSEECDFAGTLRCGICECNANRYGHKCKCEKKSKTMSTKPNDNSTCISPTSLDKICSGFGVCDCGKCSCINRDYTGTFCECHKNMCPQHNGLVCSDNGDCKCGTCYCQAGFTGPDCACPLAKDACMDGETACNNRGDCVCGRCQCLEPSGWDARHKGPLCKLNCTEKSCHSHQCQLLEPTIVCYLNQEQCQHQKEINITGVKNLTPQNSTNDSKNVWQHCPNVRTGFGCYTAFLYRYQEDSYGIEIIVQTDTQCAETYYVYGGICLAFLIVSGLIALITWKVVTSIRDRREYERFAQEAGVFDSPCENPIFAPATSTFYNPGFRKRSYRRQSRS